MPQLKLLDIIERDGSANLGQTLLRLAELAANVHRYESARLALPTAEQGVATDGNLSQAEPHHPVRTEVNR